MWSKTYSKRVQAGLTAEEVWAVWTDVNQWHTWQDDIEYAKISGEFKTGNSFIFVPKGGPKINIAITAVVPHVSFVDLTCFPLAKMYDSHELIVHIDGLEIKSTIRVEGILGFLWRKLVAENIVKGLEKQTDCLIKRAQELSGK